MSPVFADTSFYVATVNPRDAFHKVAVEFARNYKGRILTTEYVLVELGNLLARAGDRGVFVRFIESLQADPDTDVLPANPTLFEKGLTIYGQRVDKNWSLTDCISFAVMEEHSLAEALTADHHFEQAGFRLLLR
jgi:uncharacterized protein